MTPKLEYADGRNCITGKKPAHSSPEEYKKAKSQNFTEYSKAELVQKAFLELPIIGNMNTCKSGECKFNEGIGEVICAAANSIQPISCLVLNFVLLLLCTLIRSTDIF